MPTMQVLENQNGRKLALLRAPVVSYKEAKRFQYEAAKRARELEKAGKRAGAFFEFANASHMHQLAYEKSIEEGIYKPKNLVEEMAIVMATSRGYYPPAPRDPYAKDLERLKPAAFKVLERGR
ncbi:MAG: hypothetical protein M1286_03050 [Candidatus Marsarchaeota archaeon]|nr:hypothetical protein [Candidatus Marsarchaeota archaeon]